MLVAFDSLLLDAPEDPSRQELGLRLVEWFVHAKRDLPWRKDYHPYAVWISEIMLQQTQMERGVEYFQRWMALFPTVEHVARAHPDIILKVWEGLGYYSRVRNLQKAAQIITNQHQGRVPSTLEELQALPGVGEYTAGAILSIAYGQSVPAVDANVERVFSRLFDINELPRTQKAAAFIRQAAAQIIPAGQARECNQALMELGALICGKTPRCPECPVGDLCVGRQRNVQYERPIKAPKIPITQLNTVAGIVCHEGMVLLKQRPDTGLWAGFWEFPGGLPEQGEDPQAALTRLVREDIGLEVTIGRSLGTVSYGYTRYKVAMRSWVCKLEQGQPIAAQSDHDAITWRWAKPEELQTISLSSGHRKLATLWLRDLLRTTDC